VSLREADPETQRATLAHVLDAIEELARKKHTMIGIVLDEFQEIHRFGAEQAEWHLRGIIQHHEHVSYVLAGSDERLIRAMIGRERAFYKLFDLLRFGPIEANHFAQWIDDRFTASHVTPNGVGAHIIERVGPRTRDVVQLARRCFARTNRHGQVGTSNDVASVAADVQAALEQIVFEEDDPWRAIWRTLTNHQQNVLRAVAATDGHRLTARAVRDQFALGDSGTTSNTLTTLVHRDVVVKQEQDEGEGDAAYVFDSPFFREWVVRNTLPDIGLKAPQ
jgi:hypothetical protein